MSEVFKIPIKDIEPSLFACREGSDLTELTRSIEKVGVIEPIIVRRKAEGKYELVAGGRRVSASKAAGLKEIPALVRELSDEEAFVFQASENLQRTDLTDEEKTNLVVYCAEKYKWKPKEIAQKLSMSPDWVYKYLPSRYKDQVKAEAGKGGGEVTQERKVLDAVKQTQDAEVRGRCEYHKVDESVRHRIVNGEDHLLCDHYFNNTPFDSVQGYIRTLTKAKNGELPKPLATMKPRDYLKYEEKEAERHPKISEMDKTLLIKAQSDPLILNGGWKVEFQKVYTRTVVICVSDLSLTRGASEIMCFWDGEDTHPDPQDDLEKRQCAQKELKQHDISAEILAVRYKRYSPKEADRLWRETLAFIEEFEKWETNPGKNSEEVTEES